MSGPQRAALRMVWADFVIRPDRTEGFRAHASALVDAARAEPGNIFFRVESDALDAESHKHSFVHLWADGDALATHLRSPKLASFLAQFEADLLSPPKVRLGLVQDWRDVGSPDDLVALAETIESRTSQVRHATVYGQCLAYREAGPADGQPLVLVHGINADSTMWTKVMPGLATAGYRVVALDQLGFGLSDKPAIPYRIQTLTDMLVGFLEAVIPGKEAVIWGSSLGGAVAASLALDAPERVRALILDCAGYAYALPPVADPRDLGHVPGTLQWLAPMTRSETRRIMHSAFHDIAVVNVPGFAGQAFSAALNNGAANAALVKTFAARLDVLDGRTAEISLPTLVLQGDSDRIAPPALSERLHREIHDSELIILTNCGHVPAMERADAATQAVVGFLERHSER